MRQGAGRSPVLWSPRPSCWAGVCCEVAVSRRARGGGVAHGEFLEVFVDTPLEECAVRDPEGAVPSERLVTMLADRGLIDLH